MKSALIVTIYKRPDYLKQCLGSLGKLTTMPDKIILVDDCGNNNEVDDLMEEFKNEFYPRVQIIVKVKNEGIRASLKVGIEHAIELGCDIFINLDGDAIVKPEFLQVVIGLYNKHEGKNIVSGFNSISEWNPILSAHDGFVYKGLCSGINMCFGLHHYTKYIEPILGINDNWDRRTSAVCKADNLMFVISTPSVVQHIGMKSSMGHDRFGPADIAHDFHLSHTKVYSKMKVALIITIYNRPEYLAKCFNSLYKADFPKGVIIYLIDDASTDPKVTKLCEEFVDWMGQYRIQVQYILKPINSGIKESLKLGVSTAFASGHDVVINLDGDAVVKPNFIEVLLALKAKCPENIVSGFNCVSPTNPNVFDKGDHYMKQYCNGINACFTKNLYDKYIVPGLEKHGNWDYNASVVAKNNSAMFAVTKPSVVQHIGLNSSMGHIGSDYAQDFKIYSLSEVTLFGIDAHDPEGLKRAAEISQRDIEFGAVKIITERLFPAKDNTEGRSNYSKFMIRNLNEHFETSHVLTIHADGYVLNPEAFKEEWLQYDYIGAPWDFYNENMVGNGGFSLRSKKLCAILAADETIKEYHPEDMIICRTHRAYLEAKYGIKFAPVEVAKKFSIEGWGLNPQFRVPTDEFGFHGHYIQFSKSNVPQFMWPKAVASAQVAESAPGRFIPALGKQVNTNAFPNFLPERLRPKSQQSIVPKKKPMQLLILCGCSQEQPYPLFLEAQQKTWDSVNVSNVQTVFFREGLDDKWIGNIREVCTGGEYFNAHWRHKLAIDAVWDMEWDMIFRTHASSYVNKAALYELCKNLPKKKLYGGWEYFADIPEGKKRHSFISGAGILYSRDVADILRNQLPSGINIEEDVLAGRILQINGQPVTFVNKQRVDMASMNDYRPSYHYRLKSNDRQADIQMMYDLHKKIMSEKK